MDRQRRAFLLQLDRKECLLPTKNDWLIICRDDCGPVFGSGNDLKIGDDCYSGLNSQCRVGGTYNLEGPNKYEWLSQNSFTAMSGSTAGCRFRVIDYEVFGVSWH